MPFEFFSHTADIGVVLTGSTLDELFAAAAEAFVETLTDRARVLPVERWTVALDAPQPDLLLLDWLSELLYRFDARALLPARVSVSVARVTPAWHLEAVVDGERVDPDRHPIKVLIKAVTYHGLQVERTSVGWRGRVIFDV
jgi:SHS2 domain-containing protein